MRLIWIKTFIRDISEDPLLDRIVPGCTHFPLLTGQLRESNSPWEREAQLVDSGPAVASRVAFLLGLHGAEESGLPIPYSEPHSLVLHWNPSGCQLGERKCLRACGSIADEALCAGISFTYRVRNGDCAIGGKRLNCNG